MVSAGALGHQIACDPKALLALVRADPRRTSSRRNDDAAAFYRRAIMTGHLLWGGGAGGVSLRGETQQAAPQAPGGVDASPLAESAAGAGGGSHHAGGGQPSQRPRCRQRHPAALKNRPLTGGGVEARSALALRSAEDFLTLYRSIPRQDTHHPPPAGDSLLRGRPPDGGRRCTGIRKTSTPTTSGRSGVEVGNEPDILICRRAGFASHWSGSPGTFTMPCVPRQR